MSDKLSEIKSAILRLSYSEMMDLSEDIDIISTVSNDEAHEILNSVFHVQPIIAKNLFKWARGEFDLPSVDTSRSNVIVGSYIPRDREGISSSPSGSNYFKGKEILLYTQIKPVTGVPFSMQKLRQMGNDGQFPKPIAIDNRRVAWIKSEIEDWLTSKAAERKK